MAATFYFYDLETSGFSPRDARIMQFAGQRTDMDMRPLGEPHNVLIKMSSDILPDPDAVLLTGITPQLTIAEGITEAEFLKLFHEEIATPETIFVGFNSIRFDDEFMRFLMYRNFYDAYEWHWSDGRGRWDLLDVVRMTRALRPDGIKWPVDADGKPSNRLEMITAINGLDHAHAHDALSDVQACVALAELLKDKQPKLFTYLLGLRNKKDVKAFIETHPRFVYTSGKYATEHEKTTVVHRVCDHIKKGGAVVYDLRYDPTPYLAMSAPELAEAWRHFCKEKPCPHPRAPLKTIQFNRCPAIAPLDVVRGDTTLQKRLKLNMGELQAHAQVLADHPDFCSRVEEAVKLLDKKQQTKFLSEDMDVDGRLYDDFISDSDKQLMRAVRAAESQDLIKLDPPFTDDRLKGLFPLYKARNFPKALSDEERATWDRFCERKLLGGKNESRAAKYFERLATLAEDQGLTGNKRYLLEELQLYGQSILPVTD